MEKKNSWTTSKLGAFWIKKTKDGKQYLSGVIDVQLPDGSTKKVALAIYKNDFKKGNNPDFNAYQMDVRNML